MARLRPVGYEAKIVKIVNRLASQNIIDVDTIVALNVSELTIFLKKVDEKYGESVSRKRL